AGRRADGVARAPLRAQAMSGEGEPPRFLVDHMVAKLGTYLRILGCDAAVDTTVRTHELIRRANREGRVFLTRNTRLADQYPRADRVLVLAETDPVLQLRRVVGEFRLDPEARMFSRCIRCNVPLAELAALGDLAERVPAAVRARHRRFWRCPACGTVFWHGTHVRNTRRKLGYREEDATRSQ
ncbi:MAG: Mut7-C RNAse domain-containing protein, partial [Planctomycetota bacterium]